MIETKKPTLPKEDISVTIIIVYFKGHKNWRSIGGNAFCDYVFKNRKKQLNILSFLSPALFFPNGWLGFESLGEKMNLMHLCHLQIQSI